VSALRELYDKIKDSKGDQDGEVFLSLEDAYLLGWNGGFYPRANVMQTLQQCGGVWSADKPKAAEAPVAQEEWEKPMSKKETMIEQATDTGKKLIEAGTEGLKQTGAKRVARKMVAVVRSRTGEHHPALLNTAAGRKVEPVILAAAAHYLAGVFPERVPKAEALQKNCERVVTAEMAEVGEELIDMIAPLLEDLAQIDG